MKVIIIGAGPVGGVMAIILAKRKHHVKLYEMYGETRDCRSRSINITLSSRGIDALEEALPGITNTLLEQGVKAYGRIVHDKKGNMSPPTLYGQNGDALISFKRNMLCDFLISEMKQNENIEIFFNHELIGYDPAVDELTFRNKEAQNDQLVHDKADFIIGADGAHSAARQLMQRHSCLQHFEMTRSDHSYIEFTIPKNTLMQHNMLHAWPRHDFLFMALPNKDGSFCGNLYMVKKQMQKVMESAESFVDFCQENCPDLLKIIGKENFVNEVQPCENYSPYPLLTTKCEPYDAWGKVVIIGDAAHTVVPFYGQGMNSGFQDCQLLVKILDKYNHEKEQIPKVVREFSQEQCKNGEAIADLAFKHYTILRSGIAGKSYYIRHFIDQQFHNLFGDLWPLEYPMVAFSQEPFSGVLKEKRRQNFILRSIVYCLILVPLPAIMFMFA